MPNEYSGCKNCGCSIVMRPGSHHWKHVRERGCKKPEPGGKCDDKYCTCNICYECQNWNHVDCVTRKPNSKKTCTCWCTRRGKYLKPKIRRKKR